MSSAERITRHQRFIKEAEEQIAWLEATGFEFRPGPDGSKGVSTAELIARQREIIQMHQRFIANLEERDA